MGKNFYQHVRTQVKKNLQPVITGPLDMDFAIRATTPLSVPDAKAALAEYLNEGGFHVIHETEVREIHNPGQDRRAAFRSHPSRAGPPGRVLDPVPDIIPNTIDAGSTPSGYA